MKNRENTHPWVVIEKLNESTSSKHKKMVLDLFKDNKNFLNTLKYAYDPNHIFGIKKIDISFQEIDDMHNPSKNPEQELETMWSLFDAMMFKELKGDSARRQISAFIKQVSMETGKLFFRILNKDLKCGIKPKTIIDVLGSDVVWKPPYMGAQVFSPGKIDKIFKNSLYVYAEDKADGMYGAVVINKDDNEAYIESRQGKRLYGLMKILEDAWKLLPVTMISKSTGDEYGTTDNFVLTGEIMLDGVPRMKANGMISSITSISEKEDSGENIDKELRKFQKSYGMSLDEARQRVYLMTWDVIPLDKYLERKWNMPRSKRLGVLENLINLAQHDTDIKVIDYIKTSQMKDVVEFFKKQLDEGYEGLIVKDPHSIWRDGKPSDQVKMKLEFTFELRIIGFKEGKKGTKYEGSLGSLVLESENGKLQTDCSGGISDKLRLLIWNNKEEYMNKIGTFKCNGLSQNSDTGVHSVLYASFIEFRDDRNTANTYEEIKEIEDSKLHL